MATALIQQVRSCVQAMTLIEVFSGPSLHISLSEIRFSNHPVRTTYILGLPSRIHSQKTTSIIVNMLSFFFDAVSTLGDERTAVVEGLATGEAESKRHQVFSSQ